MQQITILNIIEKFGVGVLHFGTSYSPCIDKCQKIIVDIEASTGIAFISTFLILSKGIMNLETRGLRLSHYIKFLMFHLAGSRINAYYL